MAMQEGIFYEAGETPFRHFSIMFLRVQPGTSADTVGALLSRLWAMYQALKAGRIRDLPGVDLPSVRQTFTIGYGQKAFALPNARRLLPGELPTLQFKSPSPAGGGRLLTAAGISYAAGLVRNAATEEVMVQVVAETPLAVNRAIVETWKLLQDSPDPATGVPPIELAAAYTGFNREDARSWIDFHDGISNLRSGTERFDAIRIKPQGGTQDDWTEGGTYQAFMRLVVDLAAWRQLPMKAQEILVGRSKLSGCALSGVDTAGQPVTVGGCPFSGTTDILGPGNQDFREPPLGVSPAVRVSHVQRANHHVGPIDSQNSRRIYRQGFEFLEPPGPGRPLLAGLNFVSYQDSPDRLKFMLTQPGWLGKVNFGGDEQQQQPGMESLLTAHAAGIFLCPPVVDGERFPGQSIFEPSAGDHL